MKGVEETVTEPEMTVPETKDDSQEAEGDAAGKSTSSHRDTCVCVHTNLPPLPTEKMASR